MPVVTCAYPHKLVEGGREVYHSVYYMLGVTKGAVCFSYAGADQVIR